MLESRTSRTQVAYDLLSSNEYRTDAISFYYEYLLGRAPDPGGLGTGLALLNTGDTVEQFISDIVGSAEYYTDATAS